MPDTPQNTIGALTGRRRPAGVAPDWSAGDIEAEAQVTAASVNTSRAQLRADNYFLFELLEARPLDTTEEPFDSTEG